MVRWYKYTVNKNDFLDSLSGYSLMMRDFLTKDAMTAWRVYGSDFKYDTDPPESLYDENYGNFYVLFMLYNGYDSIFGELSYFRIVPVICWSMIHGYTVKSIHPSMLRDLEKMTEYATMYKQVWKREDGTIRSMTEIAKDLGV